MIERNSLYVDDNIYIYIYIYIWRRTCESVSKNLLAWMPGFSRLKHWLVNWMTWQRYRFILLEVGYLQIFLVFFFLSVSFFNILFLSLFTSKYQIRFFFHTIPLFFFVLCFLSLNLLSIFQSIFFSFFLSFFLCFFNILTPLSFFLSLFFLIS